MAIPRAGRSSLGPGATSDATRQPYPPAMTTARDAIESGPSLPCASTARTPPSHGPTSRTVACRSVAPVRSALRTSRSSNATLGAMRASESARNRRPHADLGPRSSGPPSDVTMAPTTRGNSPSAEPETPSRSAARIARTPIRSPHGLSRGNAFRSSSNTLRPARPSTMAAALPAGPAPTTTASNSSLISEPGRGSPRDLLA